MSKSKIMHRIPGASQAFNRAIYERRLAEERREERRQARQQRQQSQLQQQHGQGEASSSAADDLPTTNGGVSASTAAALHAAARILACTSCSVQNDDIDDTLNNGNADNKRDSEEDRRWTERLGRPLLISAQCGHIFCTDCWDGQLRHQQQHQKLQQQLECPVCSISLSEDCVSSATSPPSYIANTGLWGAAILNVMSKMNGGKDGVGTGGAGNGAGTGTGGGDNSVDGLVRGTQWRRIASSGGGEEVTFVLQEEDKDGEKNDDGKEDGEGMEAEGGREGNIAAAPVPADRHHGQQQQQQQQQQRMGQQNGGENNALVTVKEEEASPIMELNDELPSGPAAGPGPHKSYDAVKQEESQPMISAITDEGEGGGGDKQQQEEEVEEDDEEETQGLWRCDHCKLATFATFEETAKHEKTCACRPSGSNPQHQEHSQQSDTNMMAGRDDQPQLSLSLSHPDYNSGEQQQQQQQQQQKEEARSASEGAVMDTDEGRKAEEAADEPPSQTDTGTAIEGHRQDGSQSTVTTTGTTVAAATGAEAALDIMDIEEEGPPTDDAGEQATPTDGHPSQRDTTVADDDHREQSQATASTDTTAAAAARGTAG